MPNRITYNGKTIDFTQDGYRMQPEPPRSVTSTQAAGGVVETLNIRANMLMEFFWRRFVNANSADATLKLNLDKWFQWAQAGYPWFFARSSADMVLTELSGGEAAGQTVIGLLDTTGIVAGRRYVIRSDINMEPVKVLSVDSSVQVTLTDTLNHGYGAGDRFRSEQYWPGRLVNARNPVREVPPLWYDVELAFIEDVNDL